MTIKDLHNDFRQEMIEDTDIHPDVIADYLHRHPDFFIDYENLLSELVLPHHTGEHAISLVERQVSVLRARNRDVRSRLNRLLETARENDQLFQKTQKLVLDIIEQRDIDGIIDAVHTSLRDDYGVDACQITLIAQPTLAVSTSRVVSLDLARDQIGALLNTRQPTCGLLRNEEMAFLFPEASRPLRSAAVITLQGGVSQPLLGLLGIASFDPDHYRSGMGTMFLSYIADVLNRAIPRLMH